MVAEHGLPETLITNGEDRIRGIAERFGMDYRGVTVTRDTTLQMTPRGDLETVWGADRVPDEVVVFVTEMPRLFTVRGGLGGDRRTRDSVVLAELDRVRGAAVISLPALGPSPRRRLGNLIATVVSSLKDSSTESFERSRGLLVERDGETEYVVAPGITPRMRLTAGMVRGNRPWRLIPTLTGMTAAAAAAASFGVFFSTIWSMANALSPWRLAAISILSMVLATLWLIVNNRLWERTTDTYRPRARLYNTATVCTVAFSAVVLYVGLFVAVLVAAMTVIEETFLSSQLGFRAGLVNYVNLAWLATSMGIFAGALGSSADSHDDVLRATYGYRERLRRRAAKSSHSGEMSEAH
ncbi:hypothetical protein [Gordonia amicalis]|uniref:hypothetical protein n=1 Tax=Gordonia amicalis TaxID=89053 RepID=UPI0002A650A6|nr:hypothetical protein [Gordonia amicalis]NKX76123.1 hypothetical protein [Gordonia amicalis]UOG20012.1 hypothetical protein MTX80_12130 [Gordonia amicalis]GAC53538.1 hypothetical protein GOAMI_21_00490 [Gordonia amicalis NBRC 100051 = JCM 11271]